MEDSNISCIEPPNQTRSPSNWGENIVCLIEMIYQSYFDKVRSQSSSQLPTHIQSLLLETKSELLYSNDLNVFNFRGPFACCIKKVFSNLTAEQIKFKASLKTSSPLKENLNLAYLNNSNGRFSPSIQDPVKIINNSFPLNNSAYDVKVLIDSNLTLINPKMEIELFFIVETPTMADNKGICLLTSRCTICGLEDSAHCGCASNFLRGRKNKFDLLTVCLVYPSASTLKISPEPFLRCFCHHPVCWMQRKSLLKMWSHFNNETVMKFPKDFNDLNLNFYIRPALTNNFQTCSLYRGKKQNSLSVGLLKAKVKLYKGWQRYDLLKRRQINSTDLIKRDTYRIRIYVLRGLNLAGNNGKNVNSYLVLKLGTETINTNNSTDQPIYMNRSAYRPVIWGKVENTSNPGINN